MADLLDGDAGGAPAPTAEPQAVAPAAEAQAPTSDNWITNSVPEAYREAGFVTKYQSQDEFFSGIDNLNKIASSKTVPDFETATPEVMNNFRDKLGVPHETSGYDFTLPEGFEKNESFDAFTNLAHKNHISNTGAKEFHDMHMAGVQQAVESFKATQSAEIDTAFSEFKSDPRFSEIAGNVKNLLNSVDPTGDILSPDDLAELGPMAPKVARILDKIVSLTGDHSMIKGNDKSFQGGDRLEQKQKVYDDLKAKRITAETANARIEQISANFS